ncbi:uncharacterized protein LOC142325795 [Lycorma delicatula]|uniref:uncharacterized protein LOC142325795 n=1 Tax=Lycorma delicatula TaxID=130591 RepID=UPI003F5140CC
MLCSVVLLTMLAVVSAAVTKQENEQEEPLFTPLKLQYVAPKAFLTSAGLARPPPQILPVGTPQLISGTQIQQRATSDSSIVPLTVFTVPSAEESFSGQERSNRLPPPNNLLPELQFADPRTHGIMPLYPNSQISPLLNAAYHPGYILMAMPPSSYTALTYYSDPKNNQQEANPEKRSDSTQSVNEEEVSKSKIVPRSNSDTVPESDSSSDFADTRSSIFPLANYDVPLASNDVSQATML